MTTRDDRLMFRAPAGQADRIRRAAELEGLNVSEWLRRVALLRVAEMADRLEPSKPAGLRELPQPSE